MPELTLQETRGVSAPGLAMGLGGLVDWGTNMVFLDIMNMSRSFYGHDTSGGWASYSTEDLMAEGLLDDAGWPTEIPDHLANISTIFAWEDDAQASATRAGTYVLSYEGTGTLNLVGDVTIVSQQDGRLEIALGGGTWEMQISATDPTDNIRDISIVREDHIELVEAGALFNPDYLALIEDTAQVRFMDWQETNNSEVGPDDMPLFSGGNWRTTTNGEAPLDYMVALANQIGSDPWFCIPHQASDAYIRAFAEYVRDNLDPGLTARIEYSNETWNWSFEQTHFFVEGAEATWGDGGAYNSYFTMKAVNVAQIFSEVWDEGTGDTPALSNVVATQTPNGWLTDERINGNYWQQLDPAGWTDPASVFDELAVTTYFGVGVVTSQTHRDALLDALEVSQESAFDLLTGYLTDPDYSESVYGMLAQLEARAAQAHAAGLEMVGYEGGQHLHHSAFVDAPAEDLAALNEMLIDYVRSDHMASLYQILWDGWAEVGDSAFMHFVDVGTPSQWGSWGLYADMGDSTPRADLLEQLNAAEGQWWTDEDPGETYTQGRTVQGTEADEILTGTVKTDFLLGGAGDDTLYGGTGDDGLHGGDGTDVAVFAGSASYYTMTQNADGSWTVAHVDGDDSDHLFAVERVVFDDTGVLDMAQAQGVTDTARAAREAAEEAAAEAAWARENVTPDGDMAEGFGRLTIHEADTTGIVVDAASSWSALAEELGHRTTGTAVYSVRRPDATVTVDGVVYQASAMTVERNSADDTGTALFDTALDAALAFGSIAIAEEGGGVLNLTAGDDSMIGRSEFDHVVYGGAGNDDFLLSSGDDFLDGGAGTDTVRAGSGSDTIDAREGQDVVYGGAGWDYIYAADGALVRAGTGTDTVRIGADRRDVTVVEQGSWTILSWGDDFVYTNNVERVAFDDQTVDMTVLLEDVTLDMSGWGDTRDAYGRDVDITGHLGVTVNAPATGAGLMTELGQTFGQDLGTVYHVTHKGASATFGEVTVTPGYWTLNAGTAEMNGPMLASTVTEVALALGSLVIDSGALTLTDGHDDFFGREADDVVFGGDGWDLLSGGAGDDLLDGGAMADWMAGGDGDDTMIGGAGDDVLAGGAGADVFLFAQGDGQDTVSDYAAEDILDLSGWHGGLSLAQMATETGAGDLLLDNGTDTILLTGWAASGLTLEQAEILL